MRSENTSPNQAVRVVGKLYNELHLQIFEFFVALGVVIEVANVFITISKLIAGGVTAKLCTDLESTKKQLFKNICSFSISLSYQKLLVPKYFKNCQNWMEWALAHRLNEPIPLIG